MTPPTSQEGEAARVERPEVTIVSSSVAGFRDARLVRAEDGRYFIVSGVDALFTGWEVLVFPADKEGEVTDWLETTGGRGITHEEAIDMLRDWLAENPRDRRREAAQKFTTAREEGAE